MLFNSFHYWIFFLIVTTLFYSVPFRIGKFLLLGASYIFYMWWDPRFIVLILTSTVVDYFLGILLETASGRRRKLLLIVSLVVNLGILGFFKYYDFFASSLASLLHIPESSVVLQIILPVGVSFYTFASLSYTIDVYWGKMKAVRSFIDYALFIAFFPHLIAGPIIRARQFISQIQYFRRPTAIMVQSGIVLVLAGLIKKMVFADRFAVVSDGYFNDPAAHPGVHLEVRGRDRLVREVPPDVAASHELSRAASYRLARRRRGEVVEDREARGGRTIRRRAVDHVGAEDGDLAGSQLQVDGSTGVDLAHPRHAAVRLPWILHEVEGPDAIVSLRDHRQTAVLHRRVGDRHVHDRRGGLDDDACRVLVPAVVGARPRLLDTKHRVGQQEVLAQEVDDGVEEARVGRVGVDPVEEEVALDVEGPVPVGRVLGLEALRGLAEPLAFGRAEHRDAGDEPFVAELLDLPARERHPGRPGAV